MIPLQQQGSELLRSKVESSTLSRGVQRTISNSSNGSSSGSSSSGNTLTSHKRNSMESIQRRSTLSSSSIVIIVLLFLTLSYDGISIRTIRANITKFNDNNNLQSIFLASQSISASASASVTIATTNNNNNNNDNDTDQSDIDHHAMMHTQHTREILRFCQQPVVQHNHTSGSSSDNNNNNNMVSLRLLYQCSGESYEHFANKLHALAINHSLSYTTKTANQSFSQWGRRNHPFPSNKTILALGNSHLRQISRTIVCQYADQIQRLHVYHPDTEQQQPLSLSSSTTTSTTTTSTSTTPTTTLSPSTPTTPKNSDNEPFSVTFTNGATFISVTNTVLAYSKDWARWIEREFISLNEISNPDNSAPNNNNNISGLSFVDAVIFGKFTHYDEAQGTNFEWTMKEQQEQYLQQQQQYKHQSSSSQHQKQYDPINKSTTRKQHSSQSLSLLSTIDFTTIPPPRLLDVVRQFSIIGNNKKNGKPIPILSVPMFAISDQERANNEQEEYVFHSTSITTTKSRRTGHVHNHTSGHSKHKSSHQNHHNHTHTTRSPSTILNASPVVTFLNSRRYIEEMGLECGSDDKWTVGSCHDEQQPILTSTLQSSSNQRHQKHDKDVQTHEQKRQGRNPADMHRCAGKYGGHADLVAFDVVEELYRMID